MSKVVKCMCEECRHNKNYECVAEGIEVRSSVESNKPLTSSETCCETFIHGSRRS